MESACSAQGSFGCALRREGGRVHVAIQLRYWASFQWRVFARFSYRSHTEVGAFVPGNVGASARVELAQFFLCPRCCVVAGILSDHLRARCDRYHTDVCGVTAAQHPLVQSRAGASGREWFRLRSGCGCASVQRSSRSCTSWFSERMVTAEWLEFRTGWDSYLLSEIFA